MSWKIRNFVFLGRTQLGCSLLAAASAAAGGVRWCSMIYWPVFRTLTLRTLMRVAAFLARIARLSANRQQNQLHPADFIPKVRSRKRTHARAAAWHTLDWWQQQPAAAKGKKLHYTFYTHAHAHTRIVSVRFLFFFEAVTAIPWRQPG